MDWPAATIGTHPPIRLAVVGDPVAHSKSPQFHNAALRACGIPAQYTRLHLRPEELRAAFELLPTLGFWGINCTIPHKIAAMELADHVDPHAQRLGVVNTLRIQNGKLIGFNTDGPGLARAVESEFHARLSDLRILVLGAGGGAGRAIALQCALENCHRLYLVNRTLTKASNLAGELLALLASPVAPTGSKKKISAFAWEEPVLEKVLAETDLVINCTSLGMQPHDPSPLPSKLLSSRLMLYDTIYTAKRTALLRAGDCVGARGANGLSMLLHQGALSFEIWFEKTAPLQAMREALLQATATASS